MAYWSATEALYTLTNRRIVMRIGIVLTVTFNLPYKTLGSAGLRLYKDGTGDIPIQISSEDKIAYFHLWPHARPWHLATPEPMLRCVPEAKKVAAILTEAWIASAGLSKKAAQETQIEQAGVQTA
jgi:hypothetical protein